MQIKLKYCDEWISCETTRPTIHKRFPASFELDRVEETFLMIIPLAPLQKLSCDWRFEIKMAFLDMEEDFLMFSIT